RWDGIARFLSELIPRIKPMFEIRLVVPEFPGEFQPPEGVSVVRIPLTKLKAADYRFPNLSLNQVKKEIAWADLVWTQTIGPIGATAILMAHRQMKQVLAYIHSIEWDLFSKSIAKRCLRGVVYKGTKYWARYIYNKCNLLLVPTLELCELLQRNGVKTPKRVVFLGVNTTHFVPPKDKQKAKEAVGLKGNDRVVGYCGRVGREKDLITLYRAFLRARKQIGNLKLLIVGGGVHDWDKLFLSKEDVLFPGPQNNILPYFQALDIYVLPSLTETTSLSTLEAMSCGVPVLVTRVGQVKDYVVHGRNGYFFKKGDAYQLSGFIVELFRDDALRERMGHTARQTVVQMYSFEKTIRDITLVLEVFLNL
ncbi:hypothetical protein DRJ48_04705, partial [Candidatus Woesearchaeota archaeon]